MKLRQAIKIRRRMLQGHRYRGTTMARVRKVERRLWPSRCIHGFQPASTPEWMLLPRPRWDFALMVPRSIFIGKGYT